jgi:type I restriction enzyme R subunit
VAQLIDREVQQAKQDSWRGNQAKENLIKFAIYNLVKDGTIVEELFAIIKARSEY